MMWGWYSLSGEIGLQHYLPLHVDWLQTKLRVKLLRFEWTTKISLLHTASWSIDGLLPCRWMQSHGLQEGNPFLNHLKTTKDQLQHFQLMEQVYTFCIFCSACMPCWLKMIERITVCQPQQHWILWFYARDLFDWATKYLFARTEHTSAT